MADQEQAKDLKAASGEPAPEDRDPKAARAADRGLKAAKAPADREIAKPQIIKHHQTSGQPHQVAPIFCPAILCRIACYGLRRHIPNTTQKYSTFYWRGQRGLRGPLNFYPLNPLNFLCIFHSHNSTIFRPLFFLANLTYVVYISGSGCILRF